MRADGLSAEQKTSVSDVVTAADHAAEELVQAALREARPDDAILGEEGAAKDGRSGRRWVIDPVDGTYNFFSGLPWWCSALALDAGDESLGAVHQPVTGETWVGGPSTPTTLDGVPVARLVERPLSEISIATYVHPPRLGEEDVRAGTDALISGAATMRILGSGSCDLSAVAGGRLGAWAQHTVPDWDWLPGQALVEGAGGRTAEIEHRGLRWCLASNGRALDEMVDRLRAS